MGSDWAVIFKIAEFQVSPTVLMLQTCTNLQIRRKYIRMFCLQVNKEKYLKLIFHFIYACKNSPKHLF